MKHKILLDTDIGSDIDDALCLAYLLVQSDCELLGITTVTGQTNKRAMIASALCKIAKKKIPIYPGVEKPLKIKQKQKEVPQAVTLTKWNHDKIFPKGQAISFLQETIHSHPGEITLLCTGPLTNIALLFQLDPEIPALLNSIVLMSGVYFGTKSAVVQSHGREWNALCDPDAAAIVFDAKVKNPAVVGLDVTHKVIMTSFEVKKLFTHPLLQCVADFSESWFSENKVMTFHDALAATVVFNNKICTFRKGKVEIEIENKKLKGKTYFNEEELVHNIANKVNTDLFFKEYFHEFNKNKDKRELYE